MTSGIKLRFPDFNFTFKVAKPKRESKSSGHKHLTRKLYCKAVKDEQGNWLAIVNTLDLDGFSSKTTMPFTEKSFELVDRIDVFYHNPDKNGRYTRIIRTAIDAKMSPGNKETYCTLCPNCVFSGYIVKVDGMQRFDMSNYIGTAKQYGELLIKSNKPKDKNDKQNDDEIE